MKVIPPLFKFKKLPIRHGNGLICLFKIDWCHEASWSHQFEGGVDGIHFKMVVTNKLIQRFKIKNLSGLIKIVDRKSPLRGSVNSVTPLLRSLRYFSIIDFVFL